MSSKFYIDDLRPAPDTSWTVIRNSRTALIAIDGFRIRNMHLQAVSLDHDIPDNTDPAATSRPILRYMIENEFFPDRIYVHSMNPVGNEYLTQMILRYFPKGCLCKW